MWLLWPVFVPSWLVSWHRTLEQLVRKSWLHIIKLSENIRFNLGVLSDLVLSRLTCSCLQRDRIPDKSSEKSWWKFDGLAFENHSSELLARFLDFTDGRVVFWTIDMLNSGLLFSQTLISASYDDFRLCLFDCEHSFPVPFIFFCILHSSDDFLHATPTKEKWTSLEKASRNPSYKFLSVTKILHVSENT
jgi:hypothetical protein